MKALGVFLLVVFAGCAEAPAAADEEPEPAREPEADRIGVVFHTGPYEALPDDPAVFKVEVPEGAVLVRFEISALAGNVASEAVVALDGCGSESVSWWSAGNVQVAVGYSNKAADLCGAAESGMHSLTIDAPMAPLSGTFTIRADLPSE